MIKLFKSPTAKLILAGLLVAIVIMIISPLSIALVSRSGSPLSTGNAQLVLKIGSPVLASGNASLDYVTDGVNDNVEWAALFAVLSSHGGGVAYSVSSNYSFGSAVTVPANVIVRGSGTGFVFSRDGVNPVFVASSNDTFVDIRTDAGGITLASDTVLIHSILGSTNYGFVSTGSANFSAINAPTGRSATFYIASYNATARSKAQADYIADGVADDVQINAAIAALPISGGKVLLSEGQFNISSTINMNLGEVSGTWKNVWLQGSGIGSMTAPNGGGTSIFLSNGANVHMITNNSSAVDSGWKVVSDLSLNGNKLNQTAIGIDGYYSAKNGAGNVYDQDLFNIYVDNVNGTGIFVDSMWGLHMDNVISEHNLYDGVNLHGTQGYITNVYSKSNLRNGFYLRTDQTQYTNLDSESNGGHGIYFPVGRWNQFTNVIVYNFGSNSTVGFNCGGFYNGDTGAGNSVDHNIYTNITVMGSRGFQVNNRPFILYGGDSNIINNINLDMTDVTDQGVIITKAGTPVVTGNIVNGVTVSGTSPTNVWYDGGTDSYFHVKNLTSNSGNVTLNAGLGAVDITHGLSFVPKYVYLSFGSNPGVATSLYSGNWSATKVTAYVSTNVTNSTVIYYRASIYPDY